MIRCPECQYICEYSGDICPICGSKIFISEDDIITARGELAAAISAKDKEKIYVCRHLLADSGDTESEREFAKLLERTAQDSVTLDLAMSYYYRAAKANDPYAAYRYSVLAGRTSDAAGKFWLRYAAILGCIDCYPAVAELYSSMGEETVASYYYSLAAACDDTDSIVTMARRYYDGLGVERHEPYAKWYLDKMIIPPINAIKLAYKLRSVKAEEPERLSFPDYEKNLKELAKEAKAYGFHTAYFHLTRILSERGDVHETVTLGTLLAEGVGCEADTELAVELLTSAAPYDVSASIYLGEAYIYGKYLTRDVELAFKYFNDAAKLGYTASYERMGDILCEGKLIEYDVARAIELYDMAAAGGVSTAKDKSESLKSRRNEYYEKGQKILSAEKATASEAEEAFSSLAVATAMGHPRAARALARCYANGFGTEQDRRRAFYWFRESANGGDSGAFLSLGLCYSRGFGTAFSYKNAVKYLKSAALAGNKNAEAELLTLMRRRKKKMIRELYSISMSLIHQKKYEEALNMLLSFEELSYPKALYTIACLYEFGRGTATDRKKATAFYERAYRDTPEYRGFRDPHSEYKLKILKMVR